VYVLDNETATSAPQEIETDLLDRFKESILSTDLREYKAKQVLHPGRKKSGIDFLDQLEESVL
jgi:hypothetical protein